ncbi:unnamed protein product [Medioppia subpectinata]|uniref:N-alpha-acetyltransferase 40 n=1 Tax=Medioppia subpectinata TaxID=1979941 RepID=A0A7R9PXC5_9ACAR|nr:unnamed protein product [Medioppia subpectinata]CAG2104249.1 unnamed protein product [Medioppia subpectinata]
MSKTMNGGKGCRAKALISVANACDNLLLRLEASAHTFVTTDGHKLELSCHRWDQLDEDCQQWMISLTEENMKTYYESSVCGWNRSQKEKELRHPTARHLVVRSLDSEDKPWVAFTHLRFESGGNDSEFAVYCYELQVVSSHQRSGVGRYLMAVLRDIGSHFGAHKVMLTVFKCNENAMNFYTKALKYRIDRSSPSRCQMPDKDYEILCINVPKSKQNN